MKELWKVLDSTLSRRFDIRIVLWYRDDPRVVNSFVCVTLEVRSKSYLCLLINVSFMCISCFDRYRGQICSTYSVLFRSLNSIHYVFLAGCAHSHLIALLLKYWLIAGGARGVRAKLKLTIKWQILSFPS
jgi:hypothetical protein